MSLMLVVHQQLSVEAKKTVFLVVKVCFSFLALLALRMYIYYTPFAKWNKMKEQSAFKPQSTLRSMQDVSCAAEAVLWYNHGDGNDNQRNYSLSSILVSQAVEQGYLQQRWVFTAGTDKSGYISATPTITQDTIYIPSFNGFIYALNKTSSAIIWQAQVFDYTGISGDFSRSALVVSGDMLLISTQGSATVVAVNRCNGQLLWKTVINSFQYAVVTMTGAVYGDYYYIGASSKEELTATDPNYPCCSFVGSFSKLSLINGTILWTFETIDRNSVPIGPDDGYAGVALWGSSPVIDPFRNAVYVASGNPYRTPQSVQDCVANSNGSTAGCIADGVYFNSVIAMDMDTGKLKWDRRLSDYDAWTIACDLGQDNPNCPKEPGEDYDFGMCPALVRDTVNGDSLLIAQKSGIAWSLDVDTGDVRWGVSGGPGGNGGGYSWGAATDGERYYIGNANTARVPYTLVQPTFAVIEGGAWSALDVKTGEFVWQMADPLALFSPVGSQDYLSNGCIGPGALVNDIFISGSTDSQGHVYVMDKYTGKILWNSTTGGTIYGGAAIDDNCFYIGSGYRPSQGPNGSWAANNQLYAYCV